MQFTIYKNASKRTIVQRPIGYIEFADTSKKDYFLVFFSHVLTFSRFFVSNAPLNDKKPRKQLKTEKQA